MIVVLDFDGVLRSNETGYPYAGTVSLLQHFDLCGYTIALASFNEDAKLLLRHFAMEIYFDTVICTASMSKGAMLRIIAAKYGPQRIVFFDDLDTNVADATKHGFEAHRVDPLTGLTLEDVKAIGL